MAKIVRYGKKNIVELKTSFFEKNDELLADLVRINSIYAAQPARDRCKLCDGQLPVDGGFRKHGVGYVICRVCGHLNGRHEDTEAFCDAVYGTPGEATYAQTYASVDVNAYRRRVEEIYVPKARFLIEAIAESGGRLDEGCVDLGAGSGYFVAALHQCGLDKVTGYEVSATQIELARRMNPTVTLLHHDLNEITSIARRVRADVISLIGVLEHLREPRALLGAIRENPGVRYLYISVPLFSICVVLESLFPSVMPRQLAGGHTHLFTESSLRHMAREFGFESIGEWWFGTDVADLFRCIAVQLGKTPGSGDLREFALQEVRPLIDDLQMVIDARRQSSEVHMFFKVRDR